MADNIYDLASEFLTINSTRIVGKIIDIPASLVGLASEMHHIIPVSLLKSSVPLFANANSFLQELTAKGLFSVKDGIQNIIHLPTDPNVVASTGYAQHKSGANHLDYRKTIVGLF